MAQKAADSDIRMMIATQVAYLDGDEGMTVEQLVQQTINRYEGKSGLSEREQSQLKTAQYIQFKIAKHQVEDCGQWIIRSVDNDNSATGFYGCLIDTRDGEAIVGFRGSESFDTQQVVNDWVMADVGLLNNVETLQQQRAREYTQAVYKRFGDQYANYSFSGHSLGGNLAEHATITAPDGMPIHRCTNYDGPGYSEEYIGAHRADIARRAQYVDHYQYSSVGALLHRLPGTNYRVIDAHNSEAGNPIQASLERHDTKNIDFAPDGSVQPGLRDPLAAVLGPLSVGIESGNIFLWLTCPQLAMLMMIANTEIAIIQELIDTARTLAESIQGIMQTLKQAISNWFSSMFCAHLTGEFEINQSFMEAIASEWERLAQKYQRISDRLFSLANRLRYYSISGNYYKSRIRSMGNTMALYARKAYALARAVRACTSYIVQSDAKAAAAY